MYSGTVMTKGSGRIIGVHQKIDRISRRHLQAHMFEASWFPQTKEILQFEGMNGPDGAKRKSPNKDIPHQFIQPDNPDDHQLLDLVDGHSKNLIKALRENNRESAAFQAAWLSHIMVDGLTPAHHYPFNEKLTEIRGDDPAERTRLLEYFIMPGETARDKFINNWDYWKPNGLMTAHGLYELGVALVVAPLRFSNVRLTSGDKQLLDQANSFRDIYYVEVRKVHDRRMYVKFLEDGWTSTLAAQTKDFLMPLIIHVVLMSWYFCMIQAFRENR